MEERVNIASILENAPEGIKLWSPIWGDCEFVEIHDRAGGRPMIKVRTGNGNCRNVTPTGRLEYSLEDLGECILWPSKEKQSWIGVDYLRYWRPKNGEAYYYISVVQGDVLTEHLSLEVLRSTTPPPESLKVFKSREDAISVLNDITSFVFKYHTA